MLRSWTGNGQAGEAHLLGAAVAERFYELIIGRGA